MAIEGQGRKVIQQSWAHAAKWDRATVTSTSKDRLERPVGEVHNLPAPGKISRPARPAGRANDFHGSIPRKGLRQFRVSVEGV